MRSLKETLKKYRLSVWLCVLSYPAYLLILLILDLLERLISLFRHPVFYFNSGSLFVWIMGTVFFLAFICALETYAKERKE